MTPRRKRLLTTIGLLAAAATASVLVLNAFRSNLVFFHSPSDIVAGRAPTGALFRLGGLVETGSLARGDEGVTRRFVVTDGAERIAVEYRGILPDLFREGRGVVAQGRLGAGGVFRAQEVLAKHDENYMPPEAADAMERARRAQAMARQEP